MFSNSFNSTGLFISIPFNPSYISTRINQIKFVIQLTSSAPTTLTFNFGIDANYSFLVTAVKTGITTGTTMLCIFDSVSQIESSLTQSMGVITLPTTFLYVNIPHIIVNSELRITVGGSAVTGVTFTQFFMDYDTIPLLN